MSVEALDAAANQIQEFRTDFLFSDEHDIADLSPIAQQHALQALAQMELAERSLKLAALHQARELFKRDRGLL